MESKLYRTYTVADFKKVEPKSEPWFVDDACRALMYYYEFVEPEAAGTPEDLNGVWEDVGHYDDAAEMYGFDIYNHSNEEIRHFVEKVLTKRDDIKVAYYRPGDTVLIAKKN